MARKPPKRARPKNPIVSVINNLITDGFENVGKYYSLYRGVVANNKDPENLHRLQLLIPQVTGNDVYEYWAFPRNVPSDENFGVQIIPPRGTMVWVEFEGGNPEIPIWSHGHFSIGEIPEDDEDLKDPECYWFITKAGHRIKINDTKNYINIQSSKGDEIELNESGISLISDQAISLGTKDESSEPGVLGDKLVELLNEFITDIGEIAAITTPTGPTGLISTSPQWTPLVEKWQTKWKDFNSKKVTLD